VCCVKHLFQKIALVKHYFVIFVLLIVGCEQPPLRVGFVAGLTGPYAELGVDGRDAVLLAVAEANAAGGVQGRRLEVVVRDAGTDEASCAAALEEVIRQGVIVVVGPMISRHAQVTMDLMGRYPGVLFFSPTISNSLLSGRDDMFLRSISNAANQGEVLARYLHRQGLRRVVAVQDRDNAAYTDDVVAALVDVGQSLGVAVDVVAYGEGKPLDPGMVAARIGQANSDAVVLVANSLHTAAMAQEIRKQGLKIPLLSAKWAQTTDLFSMGGRAVEGMVLVGSATQPGPEFSRFGAQFRERYGRAPSFAAVWSYDAARILLDAMGRARELSGQSIKEAILAVPVYQGLEREIRLDPFGDALHDYRLVVVREGRFEPLPESP